MVQTAVSAAPVTSGQRVEVCIDGQQRQGTVQEVSALGYARVAVDLAWMHEWVPVSEVAPVGERLALATPVMLGNGVTGVISGRSTCDAQRYRVSWFDRVLWVVRHKWTDRVNFEVLGAAENAASEQVQQAALSA